MSEQKFTVITTEQESEIIKAIKPFEFQYVHRALDTKLKSRLLHDMLELARVGISIGTSQDIKNQADLIKTLTKVIIKSGDVIITDSSLDNKNIGYVHNEDLDEPTNKEDDLFDEDIDKSDKKLGDQPSPKCTGLELIEAALEPDEPVTKEDTDQPSPDGMSPELYEKFKDSQEDLGEHEDLDNDLMDGTGRQPTPEEIDQLLEDVKNSDKGADERKPEEDPIAETKPVEEVPKPTKKGRKKAETKTGDFESLNEAAKPE